MIMMITPSSDEFRKGYTAFQQHERRDAMYKTASFLKLIDEYNYARFTKGWI